MNKLIRKLNYLINVFYSFLVSKLLYSVGDRFYVSYPFHLFNGKGIQVGNGFIAQKRVRLEAIGNSGIVIKIGNNVNINWNCHIGALNKIIIEDNVLIGSNVLITDHSHGKNASISELKIPPAKRELYSKGSVIVRKNVWIGENVAILPNVEIGENCIVGANSVVTKSIPANCVVGGNPCRILKYITE